MRAPRDPSPPCPPWCRPAWAALHRAAIRCPDEPSAAEARTLAAGLRAFLAALPCADCRAHATAYAARVPPPCGDGSAALQSWVWEFHNAVNQRLRKPLVPFEDYCALYADDILRAQCDADAARRPGS